MRCDTAQQKMPEHLYIGALALFFGSLRSSNYQTITTRFSQEASDNMLTRLD